MALLSRDQSFPHSAALKRLCADESVHTGECDALAARALWFASSNGKGRYLLDLKCPVTALKRSRGTDPVVDAVHDIFAATRSRDGTAHTHTHTAAHTHSAAIKHSAAHAHTAAPTHSAAHTHTAAYTTTTSSAAAATEVGDAHVHPRAQPTRSVADVVPLSRSRSQVPEGSHPVVDTRAPGTAAPQLCIDPRLPAHLPVMMAMSSAVLDASATTRALSAAMVAASLPSKPTSSSPRAGVDARSIPTVRISPHADARSLASMSAGSVTSHTGISMVVGSTLRSAATSPRTSGLSADEETPSAAMRAFRQALLLRRQWARDEFVRAAQRDGALDPDIAPPRHRPILTLTAHAASSAEPSADARWSGPDSQAQLRSLLQMRMRRTGIRSIDVVHRALCGPMPITRLRWWYHYKGISTSFTPLRACFLFEWLHRVGEPTVTLAKLLAGGDSALDNVLRSAERAMVPPTSASQGARQHSRGASKRRGNKAPTVSSLIPWQSRAAAAQFRALVVDTCREAGRSLDELASYVGVDTVQLGAWISTGQAAMQPKHEARLALWCATAPGKLGEVASLMSGGLKTLRAALWKTTFHRSLARCPWRCAHCGCDARPGSTALNRKSRRAASSASDTTIETESIAVSSWDLSAVPEDSSTIAGGMRRPVCRCAECTCGARNGPVKELKPAPGDTRELLDRVDRVLRYDIRALHTLRASTTMVTGTRSYVLDDGYNDRDCGSATPVPVAPGQSHPYLLQRVRAICLLDADDLVVDVGSGDGFAGVGLSAITGCSVFGVEVVEPRFRKSLQVLRHVCPRISSLRRTTPTCACVGGETVTEGGAAVLPSERHATRPQGDPSSRVTGETLLQQAYDVLSSGVVKFHAQGLDYDRAPAAEFIGAARVAVSIPRMNVLARKPDAVDTGSASAVHIDDKTLHLVRSVCERVQFVAGDAREVLRRIGSPLPHARVVFCNNYDSKWQVHDFQRQLFRLLSRLMRPGAILVSCTQFSSGTRRGSPALVDQVKTRGSNADAFSLATLYFEVSGGWIGDPAANELEESDDETCAQHASPTKDRDALVPWHLLTTPRYDQCCEEVWRRGMHMPQYAAIRAMIEARQSARESHIELS